MANKENQPPVLSQISSISPGNRPALSRQRDHSACRRPETPLRIRKTRDNLKQYSIYTDIPPPCLHLHDQASQPLSRSFDDWVTPSHLTRLPEHPQNAAHAPDEYSRIRHTFQINPDPSTLSLREVQRYQGVPQRQRSVKHRMLTRVKQGIANRGKTSPPLRSGEQESGLLRRLSGRRKKISEARSRSQSLEISRESVNVQIEDSFSFTDGPTSTDRSDVSISESSVLTADVLGDSHVADERSIEIEQFTRTSSPCSSASPQPTPRPPPRRAPSRPSNHNGTLNIAAPYVDLDVQTELTSLDVDMKLETWVAIKATVKECRSSNALEDGLKDKLASPPNDSQSTSGLQNAVLLEAYTFGSISSLRLCYKPTSGCRVRAVLGHSSLKDLRIGQEAQLFIKLCVPELRIPDARAKADTDSLFTDLESMVGTLESDILHIEARYRNTSLPSNNVITVRHECKMKRPNSGSRWSMTSLNDLVNSSKAVQGRLAEYLTAHYTPDKALKLMQEHLDFDVLNYWRYTEPILPSSSQDISRCMGVSNPSVIVTDAEEEKIPMAGDVAVDQFSTAPSTPVASLPEQLPLFSNTNHVRQFNALSLPLVNSKLAPALLSAPKATTALSDSQCQDTARQLWHHIRRTSLSAKQLEDLPSMTECLEEDDEKLKELRRKALANKRSVGAETLKDWKWTESVHGLRLGNKDGEAPWM